MNKYFAGRTAVITGAGSGIGQALALRLAADGARLALLDLNGPAVAATARQCEEAGGGRADTVDVTDHDSLVRCAATVAGELLGHVDLLVCAAGVIHAGIVQESSWEDTRRVIDVNLFFRRDGHRGRLPTSRARLDAGHVVLMSSGFGLLAMPRWAGTPPRSSASAGLPRDSRRN